MKLHSLILILFITSSAFAQEAIETPLNTASIQVFGSGGESISLKYDRILLNNPAYKIAQSIGYSPAYESVESLAWFVEGNFILGKEKGHLEAGLGVVLIQYYRHMDNIATINQTNPYLSVGYRFQDFTKDGITFSLRALLNSQGNEDLWFGTTLGYSF